jgi:signal transduction histidine kinase
MNARRWWDLIVVGSLTALGAITLFGSDPALFSSTGALCTLAALGLAYLAWGRPMLRLENAPAGADQSGFDYAAHPRSAGLFRLALILACGVGTMFDPSMATLQTLAFPLIWALSVTFSHAVRLSVVLSVATGVGMWASTGQDAEAAAQAIAIEGMSLVFALGMGTWISRIAAAGAYQRRLVEKLTSAQDELALLHRDAGSAAERERLAREIHDTIAQSLTSLVMLAQRTRTELAGRPGDTGAALESVDLIESTGRHALSEARALVASMAPVRAGDGDLAHTVARLAERFERETGIAVAVDLAGLGPVAGELDRALEVVLLRCAQEGLANVRKHSRAGTATIGVVRSPAEITLTVADDGRGMAGYLPEAEHGFGLAGMRDRVALVGGRLELLDGRDTSEPGAAPGRPGTALRVTLPLTTPAPQPALPVAAPRFGGTA